MAKSKSNRATSAGRKGARSSTVRRPLELSIASGQERNTLRVRVYRILANGLMTGMFQMGEAVTLRSLARRLGTSAMPVREAVSRLIAERALVLLANRSVIVPRMSRSRFIELNATRQLLEGLAAEAACDRATAALRLRLSDINDAMRRCIDLHDYRGALSHNVAFHFTLYQAAGMSVVLPLIEMLWLQAGPFLAFSLTAPGFRWTARHHRSLLAALRSKSRAAARRSVRADIEETSVQLLNSAIFDDAIGDPASMT